MKYVISTLLLALLLQSCSHIAMYKEAEYRCIDSPYPCSSMQFAYYANHKQLSSFLTGMGDRICMKAQADSAYRFCLPSTREFEAQNDTFMVERTEFQRMLDDSRNLLSSIKSSNSHSTAASEGHRQVKVLSAYNTSYFNEYWKRAYQLSHRNILQHYMTTDSRYKDLSNNNKALLYGYILHKDIDNCKMLAKEAIKQDSATIIDLKAQISKEVIRHEKIQVEIDRREAIEREKERQRLETERRAQEQEAAQRRWYDDSWMNGHWNLRTRYGTINLYVDTKNQKIKEYHTLYSSPLRPEKIYEGRYTLYQDAGSVYGSDYNGYKALSYSGSFYLADPNAGKFYAPGVGYFRKM